MAVPVCGRTCRAACRLPGALLVAALLAWWAAVPIAQATVVVDGTRVIYPANRREVSVNLHNVGEAPSLVEVWIDNGKDKTAVKDAPRPGDPPPADAPIVVTPPLFRLDPAQGQTLRLIYTQSPLPADRETVLWLNVLDIPPRAKPNPDAPNQLEMAFRHRLKIFFRPSGLHGDPADAAKAVVWTIAADNGSDGGRLSLIAHNPTPFHISFISADVTAGPVHDQAHADMVAPGASARFALTQDALRSVAKGGGQVAVHYSFINDFGAVVTGDAVAGSAP
jgi:chaperone protein EcpD